MNGLMKRRCPTLKLRKRAPRKLRKLPERNATPPTAVAPPNQLSRHRPSSPDHRVYSRPRIAHGYSGLCRVSGAGMRHYHYQGRKSDHCQNCYISHRPHPFLVSKHESLGGSNLAVPGFHWKKLLTRPLRSFDWEAGSFFPTSCLL